MKTAFMGVFRKRTADQDELERCLRIFRVLFFTTIRGATLSVSLAVVELMLGLIPPPHFTSVFIALYSIGMFLFHGSYKCDETLTAPFRAPYSAPCFLAIVFAAAKVAPPGWWNQPVVLDRLFYGILWVTAAWLLLWAAETAVQLWRRSRGEGSGSPC